MSFPAERSGVEKSLIAENSKRCLDCARLTGNALALDESRVSIKATTNEGLGTIGRAKEWPRWLSPQWSRISYVISSGAKRSREISRREETVRDVSTALDMTE